MQSIAQIAPALGVLSTLGFNTQVAGLAAPAAYLVAFAIALLGAATLAQLARHLPSAGGFYTYVSTTVGPGSGFIVGWMYAWFVAAIPGAVAAFISAAVCAELREEFGLALPWPLVALAIIGVAFWVAYRGIRLSGTALMVASLIEMLIVLAVAVTGLHSPGPGGFSWDGLNPAASPTKSGFNVAVVLSIFAFTGWEGAAALAEETRNPRRAIPRAIIWSVLLLGVFYVLCAWGLQVGWGTHALDSLAASSRLPAFAIAQRLWGSAWMLVALALLNSGIAVCIACTVDAARNLYAMGRAGALPHWLAFIHSEHRTPTHATLVQVVLACAVALFLGHTIGPDQAFFMLGLTGTFVYVIVYCFGNVGVIRYFLTVRRQEFRPILYLIFPVMSSLVLLWIAFESLHPLPAFPIGFAPLIAAAMLLAGLIALVRLQRRPSDDWKHLSKRIIED
jgi:amino acid transporter